MPEDFYDLLDVPEDAPPEEVRRAFREKARVYHPDVNDDERAAAQFKTLREARDVLVDGSERSDYDGLGHDEYVRRRLEGLPMADLGEEWRRPSGEASSGEGREAVGAATAGAAAVGPTNAGATAGGDGTTAADKRSRGSAGPSANGAGARADRVATGRRRRSPPLERAWLGVLVAGLVYAAGVARYQASTGGVTDALAAVAGSSAGGPLAPAVFVRGAVTAPSTDLLFPFGVVLLPAVLGWTVHRFGRGTAWLYVLGSVAPALAVVAGFVVSLPAAVVVLGGLVALPAAATLAFLGDVGRFVLAARRATGAR
jgi:hypothetical protein